ncbi:MAG: YitT family protein, partial [Clostridia bacterium]|nr:YitT family protein [Clostridia bacterium]
MKEKELEVNMEAPATTDDSLPKKITKEDFQMAGTTQKAKTMLWIKQILVTILSSFLISFTVFCLIDPNDFTVGGAAGLAIVLKRFLHLGFDVDISLNILTACINTPLLILAFIYVKGRFTLLSLMNIGLQVLWMSMFEKIGFTIDFS